MDHNCKHENERNVIEEDSPKLEGRCSNDTIGTTRGGKDQDYVD
jgi:hypothetical protein